MMRSFFEGWRFPVAAVTLLLGAVVLMGSTLLVPPSAGAAYAFAEDFKRWCFGYDAATGSFEWAYLWMYLVQPLLVAGLILVVWRAPVAWAWHFIRGRVVRFAALVLLATASLGFTLPAMFPPSTPADTSAFPGDSIRTALEAEPFELVNQASQPLRLADLRGRIVVVTAVYASCHDTCPQIVTQIKTSLSELSPEERAQVTVVAITLDPRKDTPEMLAMMADLHGVEAPSWNSVTGEPAVVESILDRYGFARVRNEETGAIEHANLVHVIDRDGRIAFRFSLGPLQQAWLTEALRLVINESATDAGGPASGMGVTPRSDRSGGGSEGGRATRSGRVPPTPDAEGNA